MRGENADAQERIPPMNASITLSLLASPCLRVSIPECAAPRAYSQCEFLQPM